MPKVNHAAMELLLSDLSNGLDHSISITMDVIWMFMLEADTNTKKFLISQFIHHLLTSTLKNTIYNPNQLHLMSQKYQSQLQKEKVKKEQKNKKKMSEIK